MKFIEVKNFVNKVSDEYIKVKLKNVSPFAARVSSKRTPKLIRINRNHWHKDLKKHRLDMQCLMLHELGHLRKTPPRGKGKVEEELLAQLWSIRKAKEMGKKGLMKNTIKYFEGWDTSNPNGLYKWNGPYRKYVLARRKFLKEKMKY